MEWKFIDKDGLPPPVNQECILFDKYGDVFTGEFYDAACFEHYGSELGIFFNSQGEDVTQDILAYMKLPEPPK